MKYFVKHMLLWNWFYACSITSNLLFYFSVFPYLHLLGVTGISVPPPTPPALSPAPRFPFCVSASFALCLRPCFVVFTLLVAVSFIAFSVCSIVCAFCLVSIVLVFFFVLHDFCVLCLGSRKWSSKCKKLFLNMSSQKIGGPNQIVEIDERKIGQRKYKRAPCSGSVGVWWCRTRVRQNIPCSRTGQNCRHADGYYTWMDRNRHDSHQRSLRCVSPSRLAGLPAQHRQS